MPHLVLEVDPALWFLLSPRRRSPHFTVDVPGTDTVGHVVRMVGIPPTEDRGLLHRGALPEGALVRGGDADAQLTDVLERFAPPLAPWTRCLRCGAPLAAASAEDVADQLLPRTRRAYREFSRCTGCGQAYWRGAHAGRLDAVVARAEQVLAAAPDGPGGPRP